MRLPHGRDFARIRRDGRRSSCGYFIINWRILPPGSTLRLGVITSKRVGNAVKRARARRLLREVFRRHQHDVARPVEIVLVAQPSMVGKGMGFIEDAYLAMLRKAGLLKPE
jgi:ribonuclease P protein component